MSIHVQLFIETITVKGILESISRFILIFRHESKQVVQGREADYKMRPR